jgi:Prp8 binding protein
MIRDDKPDLVLAGHQDTITGLSISPDGNYILSNAMDSSLRVWDVRPFVHHSHNPYPNNRCEHILTGVHHGAEKVLLKCNWSHDQEYITAGSADRIVHLWETTNYSEVCGWAGHKASINQVIIHPSEPIIASASSDRTIILGEFSPQ